MRIVDITDDKFNSVENESVEEESLVRDGKAAENEPIGNRSGVRGGYNQENPPEDDCCPICFDSFIVPSRTSCGHWFCSTCILQYWGYIKRCKCPMCGSFIRKLIPHSPLLIQPTEEEHKILKDVEHYNHVNGGGTLRVFWQTFAVPSWTETRRSFRKDMDEKILAPMRRVARVIAWLLYFIYMGCGFNFMPYGGVGIMIGLVIFNLAVLTFLTLDAAWYRWKRGRERRLEAAAQDQLE